MNIFIKKITKLLSGANFTESITDSKIGLWKWNIKKNHFHATDFWYKKLGYSRPEIDELSFIKKIIHPIDLLAFEEKIKNFINNPIKKEVEMEIRVQTSSGNIFWIYINGRATKIKKYKPLVIEGVILDINKQKSLEGELKSRTEETEALYEESESQNEEMTAIMEELNKNQYELEETNSQLKISEYKYRTIFKNAPFGIVQSGFDGTLQNVNSAFIKIFGYDSETDLFDSLKNTHNLYVDKKIRDETLKNIDSKKTFFLPAQKGLKKDGTIAIVNLYFNKTINKYTGDEYLVTFIEDVTELQSSQFERGLFFNHSGDLLGIFDFNGTIRQASPAWTKTLGWELDELINTDREQLIHPDDLPETLEAGKKLLTSNQSMIITNRYRHKNGNYRTIRWNIISFSERGLIFVSGRDETDRIEAEQELKRIWARLDLAIKNGVIGLWDYNLPEDTLILSEEMTSMLGYDFHVLKNVQEEWGKFLHIEDKAQSYKAMADHMAGKKEYYIDEYRLKLPNGTYRHFLSRGKISEYNEKGKPVRVSGSLTDITELKESEEKRLKLEQKMQQAQKLESLGILAGGIAHDFNNLLIGVLGNTDIMLYQLPEDSPLRNKLIDIKTAAKRASELTNQMLAYSGRGRFIVESININDLILEMNSFLEASISKKVKLCYDFHKDLPLIKGDATQFRQVVMNIIINASESIEKRKGQIKITTNIVDIDEKIIKKMTVNNGIIPGEYISLEISDNGRGMDESSIKQIFDPFFTTKFTGRGLGLAAVLGIIKGHNGALTLTSKKECGTTFTIYLPITKTAKTPSVKNETPNFVKNGEKLKILIIDDEDYIRTLTTRMLEIAGHESFTAEDGKKGIAIFKKKNSSLSCVILDLTMPDMDGEEVLKELKLINPDVPVIISSGYSPEDITRKFKAEEISGFLQKPYQFLELLDKIGEAMIK